MTLDELIAAGDAMPQAKETLARRRTARPAPTIRLPCVHEGRVVSKCPHGDPARDVIWCELHRAGVKRSGVCRTCQDHRPQPKAALAAYGPRPLVAMVFSGREEMNGLQFVLDHVEGEWKFFDERKNAPANGVAKPLVASGDCRVDDSAGAFLRTTEAGVEFGFIASGVLVPPDNDSEVAGYLWGYVLRQVEVLGSSSDPFTLTLACVVEPVADGHHTPLEGERVTVVVQVPGADDLTVPEAAPAAATPVVHTGPFTRHLCYHIYPVSGNGAWQRNVGRLVERLRVFDGKIVVAIVTDPASGRKPDPTGPHPPDRGREIPGCDSPEAVMQAFGEWRDRIDWIVAENDPHLREVLTLVPMLERLPQGPGHITLYAQAKGTTRNHRHIANHWSDVQYIAYLDYVRLVEEQLRTHPVTGCFQKRGRGWSLEQSNSDWHYSGSWFWFRNADLFARDWRRIDQFWSGIEPYTSQHFPFSQCACLFHGASVLEMNLYRPQYWRRVVDPDFRRWRSDNAHHFNANHGI